MRYGLLIVQLPFVTVSSWVKFSCFYVRVYPGRGMLHSFDLSMFVFMCMVMAYGEGVVKCFGRDKMGDECRVRSRVQGKSV